MVALAVMAEGIAAAWRQRLSDAADRAAELTLTEGAGLRSIDLPGSPTLTSLRAALRRELSPAGVHTSSVVSYPRLAGDLLDPLVIDLGAAVRFGASGLAASSQETQAELVSAAITVAGWESQLRGLLAGEEVRALLLLRRVRETLATRSSSSDSEKHVTQIKDVLESDRTESHEIAEILIETQERTANDSSTRRSMLTNRRNSRNKARLNRTTGAYVSVTEDSLADESLLPSWDEASTAIVEVDAAADEATRLRRLPLKHIERVTAGIDDSSRSIEDLARLLGAAFRRELPGAKNLISQLQKSHPDKNLEAIVRRVKRQALVDLGRSGITDSERSTRDVVAQLAMAIALLRQFEPTSDSDSAELGERLLRRAETVDRLIDKLDFTIPAQFLQSNGAFVRLQVKIVEPTFHLLANVKPAQAGVAREIYKMMRSKLWRARHDADIANAAAEAAGEFLNQALSRGAARLLVRDVDKAFPIQEI